MTLVAEDVPSAALFDAPPERVNLNDLLKLEYSLAGRSFHSIALELKLFDFFLDGPRTAEHVADALGCHALMLRALLDALAALGWLAYADGHYELTPTARFFYGSWGVRKVPMPPDAFWGRLLKMLREGKVEAWHVGQADWTDVAVQRHMALRALAGELHRTRELLQRAGAFAHARSLLDVAAGHAIFAIGFKRS